MKKYLSLIGITALILIVGRLGYQAFFAYLAEHTYYITILASSQNRRIFISAIICCLIPLVYLFNASKIKISKLIMRFVVWAWIFGLVHSNIKWDPIWFWHIITIFNTVLLVCLWIYLILWFSALWSWIERKWIKFSQLRWQEIFLSFWIYVILIIYNCDNMNLTIILNSKLDSILMIMIYDSIWEKATQKMVRNNV